MKKAFDSAETNAVPSVLVDQGVDASYVRTLASCYDRSTAKIQLFHHPLTILIGKVIRQGDTISPNQLSDQDLRTHLFGSTVLSELCYAAETWASTAATFKKLVTPYRPFERFLLETHDIKPIFAAPI
ncbi:hypothetical protein RB195_024920 [Necator americanus]|uniref:Reverse transcriptase domain-containing protein n=1 Tax=Necator americanus TaxID=51031 RepID=A0ABR1EQ44_NECAM